MEEGECWSSRLPFWRKLEAIQQTLAINCTYSLSIKKCPFPISICVDFLYPIAKDIDRLWRHFPVFLIGPSSRSWVSKKLPGLFAVLGNRSDIDRWSSSSYLHVKTPSFQFQRRPRSLSPPSSLFFFFFFNTSIVLVFCRAYFGEIICHRSLRAIEGFLNWSDMHWSAWRWIWGEGECQQGVQLGSWWNCPGVRCWKPQLGQQQWE